MYDWDDLRVFLAAARTGSLSAAAGRLGIDAATVGRRLSRFETAMKATLFTRSPAGLELTAAGRAILDAAQDAETAMDAVRHAGGDDGAGGAVRLSVAEGFGTIIVAPALPALRAARPTLRIELAAQTAFLSTSRREADIAVTLSTPASTRVLTEPLTDYELGLYAAQSYLERAGAPGDPAALRTHDIVGYIDDLLYAPELRYLHEILPGLTATLCSSSIRAQREIIAAGGGIGVLPCFMGAGLARLLPRTVRLKRRFWISSHHDAGEAARVRIVRDWLKALVRERAGDLTPPA
ncbi:MAG: LysR family transcriptional regulator [Alphaproteobacteria bacterium]|nr:LysR family transcriptional regulator [Alphaproteobacteria bacterium]